MITALFGSLYATSLAHQSASVMFGANQQRMALANQMTPDMSPTQIIAAHQMDKALMFQGVQAQTNFLAAQAMQEGAQGLMKKNQELRERLMKAGALFV